MKRIEIIPLALKKIERRNVPHEWIDDTLRAPEQIVEGYLGRKVRQRRYTVHEQEMLLRVVVDEEPERFVVITAYLTSQVARYWAGGEG
ncbi:MAG: DUF4258 domain-containing protein [Candidatus Omnitrophica bacterium]|nr:DUF4258 domain-containing protein [Candidatus Omnitrophota bacterium]